MRMHQTIFSLGKPEINVNHLTIQKVSQLEDIASKNFLKNIKVKEGPFLFILFSNGRYSHDEIKNKANHRVGFFCKGTVSFANLIINQRSGGFIRVLPIFQRQLNK